MAALKNQNIYTLIELELMIRPLLRRYKAQSALLIGSYARNSATSLSDIDLIVIGGELFDPTNIFALGEDLHEASGKPVDVYEIRELDRDTPFYQNVMSQGVPIQ